jgi:hypothetical protein
VNPAALESDAALDGVLTHLIDEGKTGITLSALERVPAGARTLRIAGCRVETLRESSRRPSFESMAVIVAAQLETGRVRAGRAFAYPHDERKGMTVSDPGEGYTGSAFRIDVAARLHIPIVPGPVAVWMIARERTAGPLRIQIESPPGGVDDPEVARFIAAWQKRTAAKPRGADPRTVWPAETVFGKCPKYRKTPQSPPMPESGIAIRIHQEVLAGAFRLEVGRRHIVVESVSGDPTTAVVPISLVIMDDEVPGAIVRHLRVPGFSDTNPGEGYFNLSLLSFPIRWQPSHRYFVYAVSGESLSNVEGVAGLK